MLRRNHTRKYIIILTIMLAFIFTFETYGFAAYTELLTLNGVSTFIPDGKLEVDDVVLTSLANATESNVASYDEMNISFSVNYQVTALDNNYEAKYKIYLANNSSYDYTFTELNFTSGLNIGGVPASDGSYVDIVFDGISYGDIVESKSTSEFFISLVLHPKTANSVYGMSGDCSLSYDFNLPGMILVGIGNKNGDLSGLNEIATFTYDVNNTLEYADTVTLSLNSSQFEFISTPSVSVPNDGTTHSYNFNIRKKTGAIYTKSPQYLSVYAQTSTMTNELVARLIIDVDVNSTITDTFPPVISNVVATQSSTTNTAHVTWDCEDDSTILSYTVIAYNTSNAEVARYTTNGDIISADINLGTGNIDGTYYFVVYGIDEYDNTGSSYIPGTTDSGYASRSADTAFKWYFSVTYTGSVKTGSVTEVLKGSALNTTLSSGNANKPRVTSITMGGVELQTSQYTTAAGGRGETIVTVPNVTGDIVITSAKK